MTTGLVDEKNYVVFHNGKHSESEAIPLDPIGVFHSSQWFSPCWGSDYPTVNDGSYYGQPISTHRYLLVKHAKHVVVNQWWCLHSMDNSSHLRHLSAMIDHSPQLLVTCIGGWVKTSRKEGVHIPKAPSGTGFMECEQRSRGFDHHILR